MSETIDCRSPQGITVGLVDAIISIARILAKRDLTSPAVQEALLDLYDDEDMLKLRVQAQLIEKRREWEGR
jgi:hypothetical protein